ncbi:Eukaryotic peptide chain release factor GTP-binding subunit [Coemansia sp. RSA 2523]|nr:Eukaryotic peptide chain release factor GTP-binding subunit [Coemansia sp. RSA 2523]
MTIPARPTIVQLTPSQTRDEEDHGYTPRSLIEATKKALGKKEHEQGRDEGSKPSTASDKWPQNCESVPEVPVLPGEAVDGQRHYSSEYSQRGGTSPTKSQFTSGSPTKSQFASGSPTKSQFASTSPTETQFPHTSPTKSQFTSGSPTKSQFASTSPTNPQFASPGNTAEPPKPPSTHDTQPSDARSSIQFLGPARQTVLRMSMNSAAAVTHTPGAKPAPVGIYEPVDTLTYEKHPERFTQDKQRRLVPVYKLYEHDNWHPFCGRWVTGSNPAPFALALVMVGAPIAVFSVFVCPYMWTDLHKAPVIVFAYLAALTLASMLMSSFSDPGIIPRNLDALAPPDDFVINVRGAEPDPELMMPRAPSIDAGSDTGSDTGSVADGRREWTKQRRPPLQYYSKLPPPWVGVGLPGDCDEPLSVYDPQPRHFLHPPATKAVRVNGTLMQLKYCTTCRIYRPPRASHCRSCDNCVEHEDHHCIWLNNCIGRRNYRYFYSFLFSITTVALYIMAFCLVYLIKPINKGSGPESFGASMRRHPVVVALFLYVLLNTMLVGGLFVYHTALITRNMTTHEVLGATHAQRRNGARKRPAFFSMPSPYSRGSCLANWAVALCSPSLPSSVQWKAKVDPEGIEEMVPLRQ